jgi:hypothetical protein
MPRRTLLHTFCPIYEFVVGKKTSIRQTIPRPTTSRRSHNFFLVCSNNMAENLFMFNPLTALLLAGVATQLFVLVTDNKNNLQLDSLIKLDSVKRMHRWQMLFTKVCRDVFHRHSLPDEATPLQGGLNLNPFEVHISILITHSRAIIFFANRTNLGRNTRLNIKKWFELMESLETSRLGLNFGNKLTTLTTMSRDYRTGMSTTTTLQKEYPHFSPGALFIRCAYVMHLHKHQFNQNQMDMWETCNAMFLSGFLCLSDYLNDDPNADSSADHFAPYFPYIHHLPCKQLYQVWNSSAQVSARVPVDHLFYQIVMCIYGNAISFNTSMSNLHHDLLHHENDHEQILVFRRILIGTCDAIDMEIDMIKNCEKQRRHQMKKRAERGTECESTSFYTKKSRQVINPNWSCPFLFPSKYFLDKYNREQTETFAC